MRITLAKLDEAREIPSGGFEYRIPLNMYACAIAIDDFERDVSWTEGRHVVIPYMYGERYLGCYVERCPDGDITMYNQNGDKMYTMYNGDMFNYYERVERFSPRMTSLEFKDVCYVESTFSHRYYTNFNSEYCNDVAKKVYMQPFLHEVVVRTPARNAWLDNEIFKTLAPGFACSVAYTVLDRMVRDTEEILMSRIV